MGIWTRRRSLADTGVRFVSGGAPIDGCDAFTLLIVGGSSDLIDAHARDIGVWHPSIWDADNDMRFRPRDIELALADLRGFAWKPGHETEWQGSDSWPAL